MSMKQSVVVGVALVGTIMVGGGAVRANGPDACRDLPSHSALRDALIAAVERAVARDRDQFASARCADGLAKQFDAFTEPIDFQCLAPQRAIANGAHNGV